MALATPGTIGVGSFNIGASATDADDFIIFNSVTGDLFYDTDGSGAAQQIIFAHLDASLLLTNNDFLVI